MSTVVTNTLQELATGDSVDAKYVVHGSAKAWANLNGTGTIALRDSLNVASVVDNGTGDYSFNLTNAMTDANWVDTFSSSNVGNANNLGSKTAALARIQTFNTAMALQDSGQVLFTAHGDLA